MIDARRDVMLVGAAAEEKRHLARDHILARHDGQFALDRQLAGVQRQALDRLLQQKPVGHVAEQLVDRACSDRVNMAERSSSLSGK